MLQLQLSEIYLHEADATRGGGNISISPFCRINCHGFMFSNECTQA